MSFLFRTRSLIHGWEMTNEITEAGYYKLLKHHLVHFKFEDIFDIEIDGFNHQNSILGLQIAKEPETSDGIIPLKISIDPAHGLGGEFKAYKGYVVDVKPCDENGK